MAGKAKSSYHQIRARLLQRGSNVRQFAMAHNIPVTTAYGAIRGDRRGIRAHNVLRKLEEFLNA